MVEFLSDWIEGIAIAVIIVSILEMLLPKGNIKKYIKVVLGIYVIFSIISPFVDSKALYSLDISNVVEEYTENISNNTTEKSNTQPDMEKIYIDTLESDMISTIERQGYNVKSCNVNAVIDPEKEDVGIKKIEIVILSKKNIEEQSSKDDLTTSRSSNEVENNLNSQKTEILKNDIEDSIISEVEEVEKVKINVNTGDDDTNMNENGGATITSKDIKNIKDFLSEHYEIDSKIINIT